MKRSKFEEGTLTLETALALPIFFFIFLSIFGFFGFIAARNQVRHALIQSVKSLSMDSYINEQISSTDKDDFVFWKNLPDLVMDIARSGNNEYYSSRSNWYSNTSGKDVIKKRFIGYISGGDESKAQESLKAMGVDNGINGMTFNYTVTDGDLTVTVSYKLHNWFDFAGIGTFDMEETATAKMWGYNKSNTSTS